MSSCECGCVPVDGVCRVIYEMRQPWQERQAAYRTALAARAAELAGKRWQDIPYRMQKIGVPMDNILAVTRGTTDTLALDAAKRFIVAPRSAVHFLLLLAKAGAGKSTAAAFVIQDWCRKADWGGYATGQDTEPVAWVSASKLTRLSAFDDGDRRWVRRLESVEVLVLDDAGDEATALGQAAFTDLCIARYAAKRRTVITSNLTAEAFRARYGEALSDRIRSSGIIPNLGEQGSMRKRRTA